MSKLNYFKLDGVMYSVANEALMKNLIEVGSVRELAYQAPARMPRANFLGLCTSPLFHGPFIGNYATRKFDLSAIPAVLKDPQLIAAMEKYVPREDQEGLLSMAQAVLCCRYESASYEQLHFIEQDRPDSEWAGYLMSIRETGFRAREFMCTGYFNALNTFLMTNPRTIFPEYPDIVEFGWYISLPCRSLIEYGGYLFPAVEVNPALGLEHFCTYASHLAARSNCPEILKSLKTMGGNFTLQDRLKYKRGVSGLTAFHHAAYGLADRALAYLLYEEKPDLKLLLDVEGNTILHALACSVSTTAAGKAQQLAILDIIETAVRMPVFARHAMLEDAAPMPAADRAIASSPFKGIEDFYQIKNKAGKTALKVAEESKNLALIARLLTVPGADPREIDAHAAGVDLSKVYGLAIAALDTQLGLVQQQTIALSRIVEERTQALIQGMRGLFLSVEGLQSQLALERAERRQEVAFLNRRFETLFFAFGIMSEKLQSAGILETGFTGQVAQVMREGMAQVAETPTLMMAAGEL